MSRQSLRLALALLAAAGVEAAETGPAAGLNRFAIAVYGELARTGGQGNLALSPFNIAGALSMILAGARGETAAGIARALQQTHPGADYGAVVAGVADDLVKQGNAGGNQLLVANGVWVQEGSAPLAPVDFRGAEEARRRINRWTEERTRNRITELLAPGSISPDTRLFLSSAIYFLGKWESAFRPTETRPGAFRLADGRTVQARLMHQRARFHHYESPSLSILEMPYGETPFALAILLPARHDGLAELERRLTAGELSVWWQALEKRTGEVLIPRFRAGSGFSLREALSALGMATAFGGSADFGGIHEGRDLCLSDVVHKAFVEITEAGTEAAAATGSNVAMISMAPAPVFRAGHPFLFLIRDRRTGLILFQGRLANPG